MNTTCIERDCKVEFEGKTFESGGAFIGIDSKTGKHVGYVYGKIDSNKYHWVTNWHGNIKVNAHFGNVYRSNFGDRRRHVQFRWKGINFHGVWCSIDFNELIKVKEMKKY